MKATMIRPDRGEGSFSSLIALRTEEMFEALAELGVQLQILDETQLVKEPGPALRELARFNPDFLTAPNFNYLLLSARTDNALLHLDMPTVALWDDPLGAIANYNARLHPEGRWTVARQGWLRRAWDWLAALMPGGATTEGADSSETLQAPSEFHTLLSNPYWLHVAWDTGHAEAFVDLGLATPQQIVWHPVATYAPFLQMGEMAHAIEPTADVAFCGNLYLRTMTEHAKWGDPVLRRLALQIVERKMQDLGGSVWDFILTELRRTPPALRRRYGLYTWQEGFWEFYLFVVWMVLTTLPRVRLLSGLKHEVQLFGLFADAGSRALLGAYPNLKFARELEHFTELPRQFAATKINLCLTNALIFKGTPSKLLDCLASGGFALCEPKADLVRLFGSKVEDIFFRSPDELNAKVAHYLARPGCRREITEALRQDLKQRCTLDSLFRYVLDAVRAFDPTSLSVRTENPADDGHSCLSHDDTAHFSRH